jgi:pyrophosphate--fructose-6-phosphate 1-phosphotransferase
VQKSGYFARAAAAGPEDRRLIRAVAEHAVASALDGVSGVVGHDEEQGGALRTIEFPRIRGGKAFDVDAPWFGDMLAEIGQPLGRRAAPSH